MIIISYDVSLLMVPNGECGRDRWSVSRSWRRVRVRVLGSANINNCFLFFAACVSESAEHAKN